ncbi:MAG: GatB/YqeY domain-containing protein [Pseudomonadales bacterium]|nr:GatB/YqeY domain-containing protein [Pseudomonadales bacterium]
MTDLKTRILDATKAAMKARDKVRVGTLRLVNAEMKRLEVDERRELTDADVIAVLTRMLKQRNDSLSQFTSAGRSDLADQEAYEISVIESFMPEPLNEAELDELVTAAIAATGAASVRDMGKVMAQIKEAAAGRADMGAVSALVKARLG